LKLNNQKLNEEKLYSEILLQQSSLLEKHKNTRDLTEVLNFSYNKQSSHEDFLVVYIITIVFLRANTTIHVSDIKGNVKLSYTSGSVNLLGKQKKNRTKAISRLVSLITRKATFLKNFPVSVHLYNVSSHKSFVLNKLKNSFFVRFIKVFNQFPYNGCRKRKIRRKKFIKKFK